MLKRQKEHRLVSTFLDLWAEGQGQWELLDEPPDVETPDVMLRSDTALAGLEHTSATLSSSAQAKNVEDRLISLANRTLPESFPPVAVLLSFEGTEALETCGRANQKHAVEELLNLVSELGEVTSRVDVGRPDLVARGITWTRNVAMLPSPQRKIMRAGHSARGPIARTSIQGAIDKKSRRIDALRSGTQLRGGSQTWLLVTIGDDRGDDIMLDPDSAEEIHRGAFDRAFVLDLFENRVTELSAPPPHV